MEPQILSSPFDLPIVISLGAVLLFGVTGALAALQRGYDIVGVFFLAAATAAGGSLIRDGVLISQGPSAITRDSRYLLMVVLACLLAFLFHNHIHRFNKVIAVVDALGLGAFAVIGVQKSLAAGLSEAAAILGGVLTAVGGGLVRDVLVRDESLLFKPGQFYALAATAGSFLFVGLTRYAHLEAQRAALITIVATFALRMLAIQFNWRTAPLREQPLATPESGSSPP